MVAETREFEIVFQGAMTVEAKNEHHARNIADHYFDTSLDVLEFDVVSVEPYDGGD